MDSLTLVSCLGSNLDGAAAALAARVARRVSLPTTFDRQLGFDQRWERARSGSADVIWMCGLEAVRLLAEGGPVEVVAAPVFAGQTGPVYHSVIVVPADSDFDSVESLAGSALVINEPRSWSGHHALRAHLAEAAVPHPFFRSVAVSGSHIGSLEMVATGLGDCAAIDHTVWDHAAGSPHVGNLRVVGQTRDWPSPPILVSRSALEAWGDSLTAALVGNGDRDGSGLREGGVEAVVPGHSRDYDVIRRAMEELGPVPADLSR